MSPHRSSYSIAWVGLMGLLLIAGCSPSLTPLYKDYEVPETNDDVQVRIVEALQEAGWKMADDPVMDTVVKTEERVLNRRGIYKTLAVLEIVPVGDHFVRVLIHPYRDHLIGTKSKLPYLPGNIRRQIVPPLTESFEDVGLYLPGQVPSDTLTASAR